MERDGARRLRRIAVDVPQAKRWIAAFVAILLLAGCGGHGRATTGQAAKAGAPQPAKVASQPVSALYATRASAICGDTNRRMRQLVVHLTPIGGGPLKLTTEELIKPGIPIEEREAGEFRRLGTPPNASEALKVYLELFDPIVVLLQQRLSEGERVNYPAATQTEQLFTALYDEQSAAAGQAGLSGCRKSPVGAILSP